MPVTIDEVTAEVAPAMAERPTSPPVNEQNPLSPEMELRLHYELRNHLAIRAARLRAD